MGELFALSLHHSTFSLTLKTLDSLSPCVFIFPLPPCHSSTVFMMEERSKVTDQFRAIITIYTRKKNSSAEGATRYSRQLLREIITSKKKTINTAEKRKEAIRRMPEQLILSDVRQMAENLQEFNKPLEDTAEKRKEAIRKMPEQLILSEVRQMVEKMQDFNKQLEDTEAAINEYFKTIDNLERRTHIQSASTECRFKLLLH